MFGILSMHLSHKVRSNLKQNLRNNKVYKKYRWNLLERMQIYSSTHYLKAMCILWATAGSALWIAEFFRPEFYSFATTYLKQVTKLPEWMPILLGSQLTIIGIVFPIIVGLISVLFQKKSSRIHIQTAYQLHSGYMFAGLSGLSLAAFILIGGITSSTGDRYLYIAFSITALFWMLFNIAISIWFFIVSLNVLDDKKRDRLMLKYFQSEIVEKYLLRSQVNSWIMYPYQYLNKDLDKDKIKNIEILPGYNYQVENMNQIPYDLCEDMEIRDINLRLLYFLLYILKSTKGKRGKIAILPSLGRRKNKIILATFSDDVLFPKYWTTLFKYCFICGSQENWKEYRHITRDFYGEVYDALEDRNINSFTSATDRLVETYTTLTKSFQYENGNYIDECNSSELVTTFSQLFQQDFYTFSHVTIKSLETTGEYFRQVIDIPFSIYCNLDNHKISDFRQCTQSLFYVWHALINWKTGYGEKVSVSQEQRHRELIIKFTGEWESWYMWRRLQHNDTDSPDDSNHLLNHLCQTARLVITAIMTDDHFASNHSIDILLLWFSQNHFKQHTVGYSWHNFFLTPSYLTLTPNEHDWLSILKGNQYSDETGKAIIFFNALSDLRLLIAGYILSHIKQKKNVSLKEVIKQLLNSKLVYPTGSHNQMTSPFRSATDIIDCIIRLEYRRDASKDRWHTMLSELIKTISASNETEMISGRIYNGTYEDIRSLYNSYADIAFYLSSNSCPVSRHTLNALKDNIFPYHRKEQIITQLQGMRRCEKTSSHGYLMSEKNFNTKIVCFNETLDAYIQAFTQSLHIDLLNAQIDTEGLKNTDITLAKELPIMLAQDGLLSHLSFSSSEDEDKQWETKYLSVGAPKDIVAQNINSNIYCDPISINDIKQYLHHNVYNLLNHLPSIYTEVIHDVDGLLNRLQELTKDNDDYTLIFFGTKLQSELHTLTYNSESHSKFGLTIDRKLLTSGLMSLKCNNCTIYPVREGNKCYSLLVRNSVFGEFRLLSDSDGMIFNSSWQSSSTNQLEGTISTLWKQQLEITGSVVARFKHL